MKRFNKLLCFMLVFVTVMVALCTVSFAATIGDQLTAPEAGWQRYDNKDSKIVYEGPWQTETDSNTWDGSFKYSPYIDSKIHLKFYGTKIRLISTINIDWYSNIKISIDGVDKTFNEYNKTLTKMALSFEMTGLQEGPHNVIISAPINAISVGGTVNSYFGLDAIDIDSTGYLMSIAPDLTASAFDKSVILVWSDVVGATNYNIKRSTTPGGPYETITTTSAITYTDTNVSNGTTYYYVVSANFNGTEGPNSNEASATPTAPVITGNPGILEITMITGEIKEYDVTAAELQSFLTWYDGRSNGADKAYYMIPKKNNIKPFLSRKEYLAFDKISSFEVKEYTD